MSWGRSEEEEDLVNKATAVFSLFDRNNDGFVDFDDIHKELLAMTMPEAVKELISSALSSLTPDIDGKISRSDFVSAFLSASSSSSSPPSASSPSSPSSPHDRSPPSSPYDVHSEMSEDSFSPSRPRLSRSSSRTSARNPSKNDNWEENMVEKEVYNQVVEENENLRLGMKDLEDKIRHLEENKLKLEGEVGEYRETVKGMDSEKRDTLRLRGDLEELTNKIVSLEESIKNKQEAILNLADDKLRMKNEHQHQVQEWTEKREQLEQQLQQAEKQLLVVGKEKEKNEETLVEGMTKSQTRLGEMSSVLTSEGRRRKELEEEVKEVKKDLEQANNQIITLREKINEVGEEKEQLEHVIAAQEDKLAMQLISHNRQLQQQREELEENLRVDQNEADSILGEEELEEQKEESGSFFSGLLSMCSTTAPRKKGFSTLSIQKK